MDDRIEDWEVEQVFEDYLNIKVKECETFHDGRRYKYTKMLFTNGLELYYDEAYLLPDYEYGILSLHRKDELILEFRFKYE